MKQFFNQYRKEIEGELHTFFKDRKNTLSSINPWGEDLLDRLQSFTVQGKMIRGGLNILSFLMFRTELARPVLQLAAAIELIHSSLLIHDDIMDRDLMRRGGPSLFHQYSLLAEEQGIEEAGHFGESFGICAGDIGFFLAFEILSKLDLDPGIRECIQVSWARTFTAVGLAQMQDMFLSGVQSEVGESAIIDLYRMKTARYTFSLPLATGATAAGEDVATIDALEQIGEHMGVAFQIKDDELDLFGRETETGKPVGTDMEEGKKTLYYLHLVHLLTTGGDRLSGREREVLRLLTQRRGIHSGTVEELRHIAEKHGIRAQVQRKMEELSGRAEELINVISAREEYRKVLLDVLRYNIERKR